MKATLKLDKLNNIITFNCKGLTLSFSVSPNISTIYSLDVVDNGYLVIQTNIGEDYIDLLGMLELEKYDSKFISKAANILNEIHLEDVILEREDMSMIDELERDAFMVISDMALLVVKDDINLPILLIKNKKKPNQIMQCGIIDNDIRLRSTNMSEANKFKMLLYIERNKRLIMKYLGVGM